MKLKLLISASLVFAMSSPLLADRWHDDGHREFHEADAFVRTRRDDEYFRHLDHGLVEESDHAVNDALRFVRENRDDPRLRDAAHHFEDALDAVQQQLDHDAPRDAEHTLVDVERDLVDHTIGETRHADHDHDFDRLADDRAADADRADRR